MFQHVDMWVSIFIIIIISLLTKLVQAEAPPTYSFAPRFLPLKGTFFCHYHHMLDLNWL